jgi:hypothetical protein
LTVPTVKVTEVVLLRIPDLLTAHGAGVVEQLPVPLAPLLHAPETVVETGEPLLVTAIVTVAVQVEPLLTLDPLSATIGGSETETLFDVASVAPWSSVVVRATEYVPAAT